jgi:hypothetical protein
MYSSHFVHLRLHNPDIYQKKDANSNFDKQNLKCDKNQ